MSETHFGMSRAEFKGNTKWTGAWFNRRMPSAEGPWVDPSPTWRLEWFSKRTPSFTTAGRKAAIDRVERNSSQSESRPEEIPVAETSYSENDSTYYDEYWLAPLVVLVGIVWLRLAFDAMGILPLNLGY